MFRFKVRIARELAIVKIATQRRDILDARVEIMNRSEVRQAVLLLAWKEKAVA